MKRQSISLVLVAIFLLLLTVPADVMSGTGTVTGRMLMMDGTPMAGGMALFFDARHGPPLAPEKEFMPPDIAMPLDSDGRFMASLPAGKYHVGAVQWQESVGPRFREPLPGDIFFLIREKTYNVPEEGDIDIGTYHEGKPLERHL